MSTDLFMDTATPPVAGTIAIEKATSAARIVRTISMAKTISLSRQRVNSLDLVSAVGNSSKRLMSDDIIGRAFSVSLDFCLI